MVASNGSEAVSALLSRSFIFIRIGGNNISAFKNAEQARNRSAAERHDGVAVFYGSLISIYSATITELYRIGARKFDIINVGLAGCLPIVRVLSAAGACSGSRNKLAAGFNDALRSLLAGLPPTLPGLVYSLADSYGIMASIFADPRASGFTDISSACCGSGRLGVAGCLLPAHLHCLRRSWPVLLLGRDPPFSASRVGQSPGLLRWPSTVHHAHQLQAAGPKYGGVDYCGCFGDLENYSLFARLY